MEAATSVQNAMADADITDPFPLTSAGDFSMFCNMGEPWADVGQRLKSYRKSVATQALRSGCGMSHIDSLGGPGGWSRLGRGSTIGWSRAISCANDGGLGWG